MPLVKPDRVNDETRADMRIRFNAAKLLQTDINAWQACAHGECQNRQTCIGGPRGTCTRTDGWPACTSEGQARMKEAKVKWQRGETYDTETSTERALRRIEAEVLEYDLMLKLQGV